MFEVPVTLYDTVKSIVSILVLVDVMFEVAGAFVKYEVVIRFNPCFGGCYV